MHSVTWLCCYRDTRLRDDTQSQRNSVNDQPKVRPGQKRVFLQWQPVCNEVETRLSAERVRTEVKRFEPLSALALGFVEASV
jgi:hypothetical protein